MQILPIFSHNKKKNTYKTNQKIIERKEIDKNCVWDEKECSNVACGTNIAYAKYRK